VDGSSSGVFHDGRLGVNLASFFHFLDEGIGGLLGSLEVIVERKMSGNDGEILLGALLEEISVVRDQQQGSSILVTGGDERVDGFKV